MNTVILSGRLAANIREHYTKTGKHVIHFPLAVQKRFKKNAEGKYPVNYFQIEVWNDLADVCSEHLLRGDRINVQGRLDTESYRDEQENLCYRTKVIAGMVEFLTPKKGNEPLDVERLGAVSDEEVHNPDVPLIDDDEIPF